MGMTTKIDIRRLTRVEGHGNITIDIREGGPAEVRWQVSESPRFFEAMLHQRPWHSLPTLCARICGICSIGHTLASIRAIENAFGFTPSRQTVVLRLLLKHMETLQSHLLHIFFLAAPDFYDCTSVLQLQERQPEVVALALRLKKLANDGADLLGGRRLHPTTLVVGGFTRLAARDELDKLRTRLELARTDLQSAVQVAAKFRLWPLLRETEYVSLKGGEGYPFIGGTLMSSDGVVHPESGYLAMTNEYPVDGSTARWSRLSRPSFCVGARARFNNNGRLLQPVAVRAAKDLGLWPRCHNPFANSLAQLVECVHVVEESVILLGELLDAASEEAARPVTARAGSGVGAVEVPRGILYHAYTFDEKGRIVDADCVIPTSQNHASIQHDLEQLVAEATSSRMTGTELERLAAMLVRSYDPCISCSVH